MHDTTHLCESCRRRTELFYCRTTDEYLCEDCIMSLAKQYYNEPRSESPVDAD